MTAGILPILRGLAAAFTVYLTIGALLWQTSPASPAVVIAAFLLNLGISLVCIVSGARHMDAARHRSDDRMRAASNTRIPSRLPLWLALTALAVAVAVPNLVWWAVGDAGRLDAVALRSLGAVGALMTIVLVQGRPVVAWCGVAALTVSSFLWVGPLEALERGLVGVYVWVGSAQLIVGLVRRTGRDLAELTLIQRAASSRLAAQDGARRARRRLVQRALAIAGPVLARVVAVGGMLDETERMEARIAEETLRDELRGSRLLDGEVRTRLAAARRGGAIVSVLDEGGLEDLDDERLAAIRRELADTLAGALTPRVWVRTSTHPEIAVTIVGRDGDGDSEDDVALWHEIAR